MQAWDPHLHIVSELWGNNSMDTLLIVISPSSEWYFTQNGVGYSLRPMCKTILHGQGRIKLLYSQLPTQQKIWATILNVVYVLGYI